MKDRSRAVPVDILRILAASTIFYHHGGLATGWPLAPWGEYAVAAFIYLTGYCTIKYSKPVTGPLWKYWLGKFKSIYPTFFVLTLAIFAASFVYPPFKVGRHYSFEELAANLLMGSEFSGLPWMTEPMWFIPFVLQVYLLLPFLTKQRRSLGTLVGGFVISALACTVVYVFFPSYPGRDYSICRNWSPLFRLPEVLLGCYLGWAVTKEDTVAALGTFVACDIIAVIVTMRFSQGLTTALLPLRGLVVFFILAGLTAALVPLVKNKHQHWIALGGRASFPFFLMHGVGVSFIYNHFGQNLVAWLGYFAVCWAAAIVWTMAIEKLIPRPKVAQLKA